MTSKDVALETVGAWCRCSNPSLFNNQNDMLVFLIEQALQAHGEAEYARGLEEAARECEGLAYTHKEHAETATFRDSHDQAQETAHYCAEMIRALKPKEDGRG